MTSVNGAGDLEKREDDQVSQAPGHRAKAAALVIEEDSDADSTTLVYRAKIALLNDAIQEIGMGRYQWYIINVQCRSTTYISGCLIASWYRELFVVTGFGYISYEFLPILFR